jgi:hypothetical protein
VKVAIMDESATYWPALDLDGRELPQQLNCERGVWGKVHGAPTDFRWIAETPALVAPQKHIVEQELTLGREAAPISTTLWRVVEDTCYAVRVYPSTASDAAGGFGFLEIQLLEWKRPAHIPAALGALLLLRAVEALEPTDWSHQPEDIRWSEEDYVTPLPAEEARPTSMAAIETAIEEGLCGLAESISVETLADVYASLLAGNRAVALEGLSTPLPPASLAALLLPLPRSVADRISIAGWLPTAQLSDFDLEQIRRCWDVVGGNVAGSLSDRATPTGEQVRQGRAMARSIFADRATARPQVSGTARPKTTDPAIKPIEIALWGPTAAGKTAFVAKLYLDSQDDQWEVFSTGKSLTFVQDMRERIRKDNLFPKATAVGHMWDIEYIFTHRKTRVRWSMQLEDRAGYHSQELEEAAREDEKAGVVSLKRRLQSADGLVLVFDPLANEVALENSVANTLELLNVASGRVGLKEERPIAVCFSKADVLIRTPQDLRRAVDQPDEFVRERMPAALVRPLDRLCSNYRLFPVSAAGVRTRYGIIEPAVFVDEACEPRISPGGAAFNLMAPFTWILGELDGSQ